MPEKYPSDPPENCPAQDVRVVGRGEAIGPGALGGDRFHRAVWQALGASVRGATHLRSGLPNQDAFEWRPQDGVGPPIMLAVADGHGSPKCFRSDLGSRMAVKAVLDVLEEFLKGLSDPIDLTHCKRAVEESLPVAVERRWRTAVAEHLAEKPLTVPEVQALAIKEGEEARKKVEERPLLAYGCTLLAALVHDDFILAFQLGDGEVLVVSQSGEVVQPIPGDSRLFGNETTSMSDSNARSEFRTCFQTLSGSPPVLLALCTDGYSNAMDRDSLFKAASEYVEALQAEGTESVGSYMPQSLEKASQLGSGDDVTLGILWRSNAHDVLATVTEAASHEAALSPGIDAHQECKPSPALHDPTEAIPPSMAESPAHAPRRLVPTLSAFAAVLLLGSSASIWQAVRATTRTNEAVAATTRARALEVKANEKNDKAEARARIAETRAAKLEKRESAQRLAAERKCAQALDALQDLIIGIQNKLHATPAAQEFEHDILKLAEQALAPLVDGPQGPEVVGLMTGLGVAYNNVAYAELESGRPERARAAYQQALAILGQLAQTDAEVENVLATSNDGLKLSDLVVQTIDDLNVALRQPAQDVPKLLKLRGFALMRKGSPEEGARTAEKLAEIAPRSGWNFFNAARIYACYAQPMASGKPALQTIDDEVSMESYARPAIRLLEQASRIGFFNDAEHLALLRDDPNFVALHKDAEYQQFVHGLEPSTDLGSP